MIVMKTSLAVALLSAKFESQITGIDWFVIAIYFSILLGVAWWVVKRGKDSAADYFLAGRNLGWWIIGASIFASNIGSEHVVGLAGAGATSGVALAHYELHAWCLLVLAWVFVPFYMRSMVFTMPEFLERRFSPASRYVLSIVSIITFIVSKIAVGIFAGGVVFGTLLPELHITVGGTTIDSFWMYAGRGVQRCGADICFDPGIVFAYSLRLGQARRMARTALLVRLGHVQSVEAADPSGCAGHVGAGLADRFRR